MSNSGSKPSLAIATLVAIIATLLVNTLSNLFPPGGQNVGEIANTLLSGVLITPANYAFIIWGLIYVGLIAYGIHQLQPAQQRDPNFWRTNKLLIVACVAQIIWIFCFTLKLFSPSIVPMLVILLSLLSIYCNLGISEQRSSWQQRWLVQIPFSVYTAWISVATIVNVASALYVAGWGGWGLSDATWTAIMLVVGGLVAGSIAVMLRDVPFVLVFVWAYGAIALRHNDIPTIWITAIVVTLLLLGLLAFKR
ncbi:tryptophan-rich sensory protein [Leptolyngbya sp. FACHB-16]|uniref:tryptophan-rich sensory protein n=1 Tax=unclassified Leptolyngbya TaxID=2650499 RepID=UPI001689C73C|nr:tryptophan-rich sensory protein [Leptolyngbya sp. FACHB-16]MBD2158924.1 tryptophan-rich sensory protein [Leptolyngbya sp. FACHB-16]